MKQLAAPDKNNAHIHYEPNFAQEYGDCTPHFGAPQSDSADWKRTAFQIRPGLKKAP